MSDIDNNVTDEVTAETPETAEQTAEQPPKVTMKPFDPVQQEKVTSLIIQAKSESAKNLRKEHAALKAEHAALLRKLAPAGGEDAALALAEARAELASLKAEHEGAKLNECLRKAVNGKGFFDNELAANLIRNSVRLVGGKAVVVDSEGAERLGADFNPMSVDELARELATQKSFLVKGDVRGGSGSFLADRPSAPHVPLTEYFGPKSCRTAELCRLSKYDPAAYRALRERAKAAGLVQ